MLEIVFQMTRGTNGTWAIKTLHTFNGTDGIKPDSLVRQGDVLYGTTFLGGTSNLGTVFKATLRPKSRRGVRGDASRWFLRGCSSKYSRAGLAS